MITVNLKEGQIFEVSGNTMCTYLYANGKITQITMQEFNVINNVAPEERGNTLFYFRLKNQ